MFSKDISTFSRIWTSDLPLTEPLLNISPFILYVLSDRLHFLNNSKYLLFCTKCSAGSRILEPAGLHPSTRPSQRSASHCSCVSCRDNRRKSILVAHSLLQNRPVTTNIEIHSLIFHPIQFAQIRRNFL